MEEKTLKVLSNIMPNPSFFMLTLGGAPYIAPGQFIDVKIDGVTLRRPFSVFDFEDGELCIGCKIVGKGTEIMSKFKSGDQVNVLVPLGNGFDMTKSQKPLLVGGGVGGAPLYYLAKSFAKKGIRPQVVLAARTKTEIEGVLPMFERYADVIVATDDGSLGEKGNAVEVLKRLNLDFDYYYACGPQVMMKYLAKYAQNGELCLESRMGCGFGACMGCSIKTTKGAKRVCKDGPVFDAAEVIFDD